MRPFGRDGAQNTTDGTKTEAGRGGKGDPEASRRCVWCVVSHRPSRTSKPSAPKRSHRRSVRALINDVRKAGCDIARVEYDLRCDKLTITTTQAGAAAPTTAPSDEGNPWDQALADLEKTKP
jgi:hypothetical protein